MADALLTFCASLIEAAYRQGVILDDEKKIAYGTQLLFRQGDLIIPINIYSSKKKGITTVIGGSPKSPLRAVMQQLLNVPVDVPENRAHGWNLWAGTDECGKGDFFGPLVVSGFICSQTLLPKLASLGIKDSKLLKDTEICRIAHVLLKQFPDCIETLSLMPSRYNSLYSDFRKQGKKLNELLAWMHGRVIVNLHKRYGFDGVVVDKFAREDLLPASLKELKGLKIIQRTKAEDDIAVAAASIISRYRFIQAIDALGKTWDMVFPKGASAKVLAAGKTFAQKHGKSRLTEVSKTHFKTFDKI
ncbi:MAG: ribonuclease HIII [Candidatus Cloacimonetes bacterium]|nr:ribonuclease HIII [Candidatus Cloacimonadota bacterium]